MDANLDFELLDPVPVSAGGVPAIFQCSPETKEAVWEFFTATISNKHTRKTYARGIRDLSAFAEGLGISLIAMKPIHVAAWVEDARTRFAITTVKLYLTAVKMLFNYLVIKRVLETSPAAPVKGPRFSRDVGTTPVVTQGEARELLASIDVTTLKGRRDRAMIAVMLMTFCRAGALVQVRVRDVVLESGRTWLHLFEKGSKLRKIPVSAKLQGLLEPYLEDATAGVGARPEDFLFRSMATRGKKEVLSSRPLSVRDVFRVSNERARAVGIENICSHSMRGAGITAYLENGGQLEVAQLLAGHASMTTTQLYDRRNASRLVAEIERIL